MKQFIKEFQAFISKGNVMDLAVGVIIGAAFSAIVNSLVKDIINPLIGALVGRPDFSNLFIVLKPVEGYTGPQTYDALVKAGATVFGYGAFLTAVVQFLLLAFVIFWLVKVVTNLRKRLELTAVAKPTPENILLLREIRDLMKQENASSAEVKEAVKKLTEEQK
jgi:large conductance mechanosensitive channel